MPLIAIGHGSNANILNLKFFYLLALCSPLLGGHNCRHWLVVNQALPSVHHRIGDGLIYSALLNVPLSAFPHIERSKLQPLAGC